MIYVMNKNYCKDKLSDNTDVINIYISENFKNDNSVDEIMNGEMNADGMEGILYEMVIWFIL